ncbi:hypothetical protein ABPG77_004057 [Micractinium sp. CCAP 211/92]
MLDAGSKARGNLTALGRWAAAIGQCFHGDEAQCCQLEDSLHVIWRGPCRVPGSVHVCVACQFVRENRLTDLLWIVEVELMKRKSGMGKKLAPPRAAAGAGKWGIRGP